MNDCIFKYEERKLSEALQEKIDEAILGLSNMSIEKTDLSNEKNQKNKLVFWRVKNTIVGVFRALIGSHFTVEIVKVSNGFFTWVQPFIYPLIRTFNTTIGKRSNTGLIVLVKCGNTFLMSIGNEPGAKKVRLGKGKKVHPVIKSSLQMSLQKMNDVLEGQIEKDPGLVKILCLIPKIEDLIWLPTNIGDSNKGINRVWKTMVDVSMENLSKIKNNIGPSIILSVDDIKEIITKRPDLLNSHGLEVLSYILAQR